MTWRKRLFDLFFASLAGAHSGAGYPVSCGLYLAQAGPPAVLCGGADEDTGTSRLG